MNDLDMKGVLWRAIEEFVGTFDGQKFQIENLGPAFSPYPFIQENSGTIKDVTFKNSINVVGINAGEMIEVIEVGSKAGEMIEVPEEGDDSLAPSL